MTLITQDDVPGVPDWIADIKGAHHWGYYEPEEGHEVRRPHPFTRMKGPCWSDVGKGSTVRWRPGVWDGQFVYPDNWETIAHGMGEVAFRVVHVAKLPKPYPRRVFYTRQFITPDGREYGKSKMIIHGISKFRQICAPFKMDDFVVNADREAVADPNADRMEQFA